MDTVSSGWTDDDEAGFRDEVEVEDYGGGRMLAYVLLMIILTLAGVSAFFWVRAIQ